MARAQEWECGRTASRSLARDPVPRRPGPHPGRKRDLGVGRARDTFHDKLTQRKTQPRGQATKANGPAQTHSTKRPPALGGGRTCPAPPRQRTRPEALAVTTRLAGEHRTGDWTSQLPPARTRLWPPPTQGKEPPFRPRPAWLGGPTQQPRPVRPLVSPETASASGSRGHTAARPQHRHTRNVAPDMLLKKERTEEGTVATALNTACDALHVLGGDGRAGTEVGRAPAGWRLLLLRGQGSPLPISAATVHDSKGEVAGCWAILYHSGSGT